MERICLLEEEQEVVVVENERREGSRRVALMTQSEKSSATRDLTASK